MQDDRAQRFLVSELGLGSRQLFLPRVQAGLQHRDVDLAACHRVDEAADLGAQLGHPFARCVYVAGHALLFLGRMLVVPLDHCRYDVRCEQLALQPGKHALLEALRRYPPAVGAAAPRLAIAAPPPISAEHRVGAAALAASDETGKDVLRPPLVMCRHAFVLGMGLLYRLPASLVDDAQMLGRYHHHGLGRVGARYTPAGLRVLAHLDPVIGDLSGIGGVVEDPIPAAAGAG